MASLKLVLGEDLDIIELQFPWPKSHGPVEASSSPSLRPDTWDISMAEKSWLHWSNFKVSNKDQAQTNFHDWKSHGRSWGAEAPEI